MREADGLAALALAWTRLESHATLPTQSADFIAALTGSLLADTPIRLFEAAGADGVEAHLPLCHGAGAFAPWRIPGAAEVFEPGDAVCRDGAAAARLARMLAAETRPVDLARIPAASPLIAALETAMKGRGVVVVRPATPSPTIAIGPGWREPESQFNSRRRSDFRRAARRAEEFGAVADFPPKRCAVCFDWRDAFANVPSPASARQMPERKTARPITMRRLRNADCEGDFFFIDEI